MISEEDTDKYLAEVLEILKEIFEGGNKWALLNAIYCCLQLRRQLPEWLRLAFLDAYEARARFEIRSWDDVFDRPVPKGTHLEIQKRKAELRPLVLERARELGLPIDRGLFEKIGKELGVPGSTIDDLYYDERSRELRELYEIADRVFETPEKK
jgi:hypothetical protein